MTQISIQSSIVNSKISKRIKNIFLFIDSYKNAPIRNIHDNNKNPHNWKTTHKCLNRKDKSTTAYKGQCYAKNYWLLCAKT